MKTILFATDFSKTANNALEYAIGLAKFAKAKLVLFHAYHVPVPLTDMSAIMPATFSELEQENKKAIKKLENKVKTKTNGKIKTESAISSGMPVEEIVRIASRKKADLVITGIKGAGKFSQAFIGSTATFLMKKTRVPVLIIPENAKFNAAKRIVLAYDYNTPIRTDAMKSIKEFAKIFDAEIIVLNVVRLLEEPGQGKASGLIQLKSALKGIKHDFFFAASENTTDEINSFINKHRAGMLVMFPHKHNVLDKLLHHTGDTKQMAFRTKIPLLTFHD